MDILINTVSKGEIQYGSSNTYRNHDNRLTFEEFLEGSKKDPTIVQALTLYDSTSSASHS
ncbi:hypothetical protein CHS0354_013599 [Potamilus streckersoni]|uniref:Uncharacterized protein n=1 Tax=Potamilus streckersoni TaxID=2493646 RepID=A0AAE0SL41_9BIVA|nr:hypothetical protein CHS0354_013599 [Potamilus streckersoni]